MSDFESDLSSIKQLWKLELWEELAPWLDAALAGKSCSGEELLILCSAALQLGRSRGARELLAQSLESGVVTKARAASFFAESARSSLSRACSGMALGEGRTGPRPSVRRDTRSSFDLSLWYRPEGELGVYVPNQLSESPFEGGGHDFSDEAVLDDASILQPFSGGLGGQRVLAVGCQGGVRARFLAERGAKVTAVTDNPEDALRTASHCKGLPNVAVVLDSPGRLPFRGCFDVVVISGFQEGFTAQSELLAPLSHLLSRAYAALVPNGSLLISGHNALALRHFNNQPDAYGREGSAVLEGRSSGPQLLSSSAMGESLSACGFSCMEPCAVMGSIDQPRLVVSPRGSELSSDVWNLEALVRRSILAGDGSRLARFSESRVMHSIVGGGQLAQWSDGYLFLAHKSSEKAISTGHWLASYFADDGDAPNARELRFVLTQPDAGGVEVEERSLHGSIAQRTEPYINGVVYRDLLDDLLQVPGWAYEEVVHWSAIYLRCLLSTLESEDSVTPDEACARRYKGDYDLWVADQLLGATPDRWIKTPEGSFECLRLTSDSDGSIPMALVLYAGITSAFSTIRSVAEPADSRWLESEQLALSLIASLGYTFEPTDVERLQNYWLRVYHAPLPTPQRFVPREKPRALKDSAKLYWATESEGFSENKTSADTLALDGSEQTLRLAIASPGECVTALRFDVSNRPGCFEITEMNVIQANGEVLWQWQHSREELSGIQGATLVVDPPTGRSCLLSRGNDPQFILNLPQPSLDAAAGGVLQVTLSAWPQRL